MCESFTRQTAPRYLRSIPSFSPCLDVQITSLSLNRLYFVIAVYLIRSTWIWNGMRCSNSFIYQKKLFKNVRDCSYLFQFVRVWVRVCFYSSLWINVHQRLFQVLNYVLFYVLFVNYFVIKHNRSSKNTIAR